MRMAIFLQDEKEKKQKTSPQGCFGDLTDNYHVGTGWVSQRDWKDCFLRLLTALFGRNMLTGLSI